MTVVFIVKLSYDVSERDFANNQWYTAPEKIKSFFCEKYGTKDISAEEFLKEYISPFVDETKMNNIKKLRSASEQKIRLYAHALVKLYVSSVAEIPAEKIKFSCGKNGKPYIKDCPLQFNISHTKNAFSVAFSTKKVGVDIEKRKKVNFSMIQRFFSEGEQEHLKEEVNITGTEFASCDGSSEGFLKRVTRDERTLIDFFYIWTRKEAYLKYTGEGITKKLNSFDVIKGEIADKLSTFTVDDYTVSVCSEEPYEKTVLSEEDFVYMMIDLYNQL